MKNATGTNAKPARRPKPKPRKLAVLAVAALCATLYGWMFVQSRVVRAVYADVYLRDLPDAFDGVRLLYLSDVHIAGQGDIARARRLMDELQAAQPDLLLLGGDYSDTRLWTVARSLGRPDAREALRRRAYGFSHQWMRELVNFRAPLGKFAVQGNHDVDDAELAQALSVGGVTLLQNGVAAVEKDGARLMIAGLGDYREGDFQLEPVAGQLRAGDCVVLLCHNPDALPLIATTEAADGGAWADLTLCGHTHGGQVRLGRWTPASNSEYGDRYLTGWRQESDGYALISNGVGTSMLPVRLCAPAQAHVITLHKSRQRQP